MGRVIFLNKKVGGGKMEEKNNLFVIAKLILFFANKSKSNLYKTKLNKLLFYTQFLYYKLYNERILQNEFIKDYHGPVLEDMNQILNKLDNNLISLQENKYGVTINPLYHLNESAYTEKELYILNMVQDKFEDFTAADISEYSHKESLWINTPLKGYISLNRVSELNELYS